MIVSERKSKITGPREAAQVISAIVSSYEEHEQDKEHFYAIGLNQKNVIQYVDLISIGTLNESLVHPREVFRLAIMRGCNSIIVAHNHPSGEVTPSPQDVTATKRLCDAGKIIGIEILDHVITAGSNWLSLRESGHFS